MVQIRQKVWSLFFSELYFFFMRITHLFYYEGFLIINSIAEPLIQPGENERNLSFIG